MPLSEEQIQRYSRQILLGEVGGIGQTRLLAGGLSIPTGGAAVQVGATYLAASGVAISAGGTVERGEEGFLFSLADIGVPRRTVLDGAVNDLNPDADGPRGNGCLAALPGSFSGPGPWVAIGGRDGQGAILYRSESGCEECFHQSAAGLVAPPEGANAVFLGALSALVYQRMCLGLGPDLGGLWVDQAGRLSAMELRRCTRCN